MGRFDGHVAVVTGGDGGIGLAAAKRFHREGAGVAIAGRDERSLRRAARSIGGDVLAVPGDVTRPEEIDLLFDPLSPSAAPLSLRPRIRIVAVPRVVVGECHGSPFERCPGGAGRARGAPERAARPVAGPPAHGQLMWRTVRRWNASSSGTATWRRGWRVRTPFRSGRR
ncbi:SDR family NAD(P)-dependent oxidoreductase [Streptosporangium sp. NPDC051023]|uniref:SDR family NAD(P)-dependent oxidoreductase n=1 Tax=Streptosporangium sp. NPDC051023 TaxID=3155410 RepID=UPI00344C12EA